MDQEQASSRNEQWRISTHVDCLVADKDLLNLAAKADFRNPIGIRLTTQLVKYQWQIMSGLIQSGKIFEELRTILKNSGQGFYLPPRPLRRQEIDSLAYDSVHSGLELFLGNERAGKGWDPDKGATLVTYFGICCKLGFRTPWKRMVTEICDDSRQESAGLFRLICGAKYLIHNAFEGRLVEETTGWSGDEV